jgi:hypothetical protein
MALSHFHHTNLGFPPPDLQDAIPPITTAKRANE